MTAPIDRIENVRAQVEDVERQMTMDQMANVQLSPKFAWQLLSACKSLLGPTYEAEIRKAKAEAWDEGHSWGWSDSQEAHDVRQEMNREDWSLKTPNPYRADRIEEGQ